ncbi:ankyrin [Ceratobasidium sp. AG-I]|nr:ankyrin [Ceratobasidium sp. AG-I]
MSLSIHNAALQHQASLVRSLLSAEPKLLDAKDVDERTALHWAASSGAIEIVQDLISRKAAIDSKDNSGWTPLMIAVRAMRTSYRSF